MTTVQRKMIEDLRATLGEQADPAAVVERLYESGVMDDIMARRYVVKLEFVLRYGTNETGVRPALHINSYVCPPRTRTTGRRIRPDHARRAVHRIGLEVALPRGAMVSRDLWVRNVQGSIHLRKLR